MKNSGFTLLELMIVIVIIAILASIAYPSYQSALRDSRRVVAQADLLELAGDLERYYTTNFSYAGAILTFATSPQDGTNIFYDLAFASGSPTVTTFRLTATPVNAQAGDGCDVLTFDHTNTKGPVGCW